jgi:branched-chain amino acid transport system substrate-binding protein
VTEAGGVKIGDTTYKIQFITEDSKATAEGAATAASKLVTQDGVKFVIGAMLEDEVAAIYGVTGPAGVLYGLANINIPHHASDVSPDHPLEVRLSVSPDDNQGLDLDYILTNYPNAKKIAISAPALGYKDMIARLKTQATARGMEVVYTEEWAWGTTDFVPTMTKVNASNPDIIFAMNSGQATDQLKAARSLGFKGVFVSNSPLGADNFVAQLDASMLSDVIVNSPDVTHPTDAMKPLMEKWTAKWPNDLFVSDCIHAYDMPWILVQAMQ